MIYATGVCKVVEASCEVLYVQKLYNSIAGETRISCKGFELHCFLMRTFPPLA